MFDLTTGVVIASNEAASAASIQFVIEIAVCATIVLTVAWLATRYGQGWSAAIRHRIWCLSFFGLLILPIAILFLHPMKIPLLPPTQISKSIDAEVSEVDSQAGFFHSETRDFPINLRNTIEPQIESPNQEELTEISETAPAKTELKNATTPVSVLPGLTANVKKAGNPIVVWLIAIWGTGFAVVVAPVLYYAVANRRRFNSAKPIGNQDWLKIKSELCSGLAIRQSVQLVELPDAVVPMTCGIFKSTIAIPLRDIDCSESKIRSVLVHELAHIRRQDVLTQVAARIVCALYWFHPLAWLGLARMRFEREMACDDLVVSLGAKPADYALQLVQFARRCKESSNCLEAAMAASTSKLECRITSLVDTSRSPRLPMTDTIARLLVLSMILIIVALATIRVGHRSNAMPLANLEGPNGAIAATSPTITSGETANGEIGESKVGGIVTDTSGNPVAEANVSLVYTKIRRKWYTSTHEVVAQARTDTKGAFEISVPPSVVENLGDHKTFSGNLFVAATSDGLIADWQKAYDDFYGWSKENIKLRLEKDCLPIHGRLIDQNGNPVANATVTTLEISEPPADADLEKWHELAKHNPVQKPGEMLPSDGNAIHHYPMDKFARTFGFPGLHQTTKTNGNGEFVFENVGKDRLALLEISGKGIAKTQVRAIVRKQESVPCPTTDPRCSPKVYFGADFEIAVQPSQDIFGVVKDKDTNQPISGVKISVRSFGYGNLSFGGEFATSTTNEDGKYKITGIPRPGVDATETTIDITPSQGTAYLARTFVRIPKAADIGPVESNFKLKKAVWATGKLVNADTGEPVSGWLNYHPSLENENAKQYANFKRDMFMLNPNAEGTWPTDANGNFRIPVIQGKGLITALADKPMLFEAAYSDDELKLVRGLGLANREFAPEFYQFVMADAINSAKLVNVEDKGASDITIRMLPESVRNVKVRDVDGNPVEDARCVGVYSRSLLAPQLSFKSSPKLPGDEASIYGLNDSGERLVIFQHSDLNIAKAIVLTPDGTEDVTLEPCGTIRGKITGLEDVAGKRPVVKVAIPASACPKGRNDLYHEGYRIDSVEVQPDGSFEATGIIPGVEYQISIGAAVRKVSKDREQVEDLGEIEFVSPAKKKAHKMMDLPLLPSK